MDGEIDAPDRSLTGQTVLGDFAPGETERFRGSWMRSRRLVLAAMAAGPLFGAFILLTPLDEGILVVSDPVKALLYTVPVVGLYELVLYRFHRKNARLLAGYAGWELTEEGVLFPVRRDKETKDLGRRFVPYEEVDAVYFEGTPRLVSLVWPSMPDHVRARYGDEAPRALDEYVVVVEADGSHTAIEKDDVADVEAVRDVLVDRGVKVVG